MTREDMLHSLITRYEAIAYTHNYIFGFIDRGNVYMVFADSAILPYITCLDKASRGAGYALRFKPTKAQKELLKTLDCFILCSEKFFNEIIAESVYNRGEVFEMLCTEYFGQVWEKDSVPFTQAGDIEDNGVAYQVKFQSATFCNEKTLAHLAN